MAFGKNKPIGQSRKSGHPLNKKNKTCFRVKYDPSLTRVKVRKNILISEKGGLPIIIRKTTPTANHFQPAPIDNSVFNNKESGTPRKDDSDKASIMAKSRVVKKNERCNTQS